MAIDQARKGPRSLLGTSSRLPITSTGIRAAKSSMKSALFLSDMASSSRATSAATPASILAMAR